MEQPTLGSLVRQAREAAGLSQYALGHLAGVSGQAVAYVESGERDPYFVTVVRLARVLGLDYVKLAECVPTHTPVERKHVGRPRKQPVVTEPKLKSKPKRGRPRKEKPE